MEFTTPVITQAFQSPRLEYIKADISDERLKEFVHEVVHDPFIQAMATSAILQPKGKADFEATIKSMADSLLGLVIALPPGSDGKINSNVFVADDTKPTYIGIMCIGWGGISTRDMHHRKASIGISLATAYQNKGYGREAVNWMLDWGFRHAGLHTIQIDVASYNPRALRLYESIGFKLEGRRRETIWQNRKWYDLVEYGMTEREWEELRGHTPS